MKNLNENRIIDINEKSLLLGVCFWLQEQPEAKEFEKDDERSLFYHVAPITYAKLILRFLDEHNKKIENNIDAITSPTIDDSGVVAVDIASKIQPKLTEQEEAIFIAGFQECIKYLKNK
jgi:hypothetical protein